MLQSEYSFWIKEVWFSFSAPLIFATYRQSLCARNLSSRWICDVVARNCLFGNHFKIDTTKSRCCANKIFIDEILRETDSFKNLCAGIRSDG